VWQFIFSVMAKAQKRMEEFVHDANILVPASHPLPLLRVWCNRGIFLHRGKIEMMGKIDLPRRIKKLKVGWTSRRKARLRPLSQYLRPPTGANRASPEH